MADYKVIINLIDANQTEARDCIDQLLTQESDRFSLADLCFQYRLARDKPIDPRTQVGSYIVERLIGIIEEKDNIIMTKSPFHDSPYQELRELSQMLLILYESQKRGDVRNIELEEPTL